MLYDLHEKIDLDESIATSLCSMFVVPTALRYLIQVSFYGIPALLISSGLRPHCHLREVIDRLKIASPARSCDSTDDCFVAWTAKFSSRLSRTNLWYEHIHNPTVSSLSDGDRNVTVCASATMHARF